MTGYVISDQDALLKATGLTGEDQPLGYAPYNQSSVVAAASFLKAGLDLEDSDYNSTVSLHYSDGRNRSNILQHLPEAVAEKLITEATIDTSVARALTVRFELGEFDAPEGIPYKQYVWQDLVQSKAHQALAREATQKSLVLLRNENHALPLTKEDLASDKIAVVGPWASGWVNCSAELVGAYRRGCGRGALYYGDYSPGRYEFDQANPWPNVTARSNYTTTLAEGLATLIGHGSTLAVESGCVSTKERHAASRVCGSNFSAASVTRAVQGASVVIVALGTGSLTEAEGQDRSTLELPGHQEELLQVGRPIPAC